MKALRTITTLTALLLSLLNLMAQEVTVVVTPVQQILPPQAALYVSNPGRYFNVQITNNTQEAQKVYLGLQVEQVNPSSGLSVSTPPKRQPEHPIIVPAGSMRQISPIELKTMFNYLPASEIATTPGLFTDYQNGGFALLPEGQYQAHLTAYKWDPTLSTPVVVSNPNGGVCLFTVCYKAQAPEFLTPLSTFGDELSVARLSPLNAQFTWKQPTVNCAGMQQFRYSFRVVELMPGQQPDDAIDKNPTVYQVNGLMAPTCIIPMNVIKTKMDATRTYIARVEARQSSLAATMLDYVMIENEGRSNLKFFNISPDKKPDMAVTPPDSTDNDSALIAGTTGKGKKMTDSLYAFRNPTLLAPTFYDESSRKVFVDNDIQVNWRKAWHLGGEGTRADTVQFEYEVQLFKSQDGQEREAMFAEKPFYTKKTEQLVHTVHWDAIKDSVEPGQVIVLRVVPTSPNTPSIEFVDDSVNVKDFALSTRLSQKIEICNNDISITNFTPTSSSAADLKGKTVGIGQFQMLLDEVEQVKGKQLFKGKGHVEWKPGGVRTMICVKFDSLKINTDNIVIDGKAVTYQRPEDKVPDDEAVQKIFSDTGLDNLVGAKGVGAAKNLGEKVHIGKYYDYYAKGKAIYNNFMTGEIRDLYLPLQMPHKLVNKGPIDVQIVSMTFAPGYATMNLLGLFMLPESKVLDDNILIVGSPRVCMEPDHVLPRTGAMSLLADFNIRDPKSDYEMCFKAPEDVLSPTNGCYITWGNDTLGGLSLDLDMKIPNLKKEEGGKVTDQLPTLNIRSFIRDWEDWTAQCTMETFQSEDMPGFSFQPGVLLYDHSQKSNASGMGAFPDGYDKGKAGIASDNEWQGLYMGNLSLKFPKTFQITKNSDKRLALNVNSLFIDRSGISLQLAVKDPINNGKGDNGATVGGWAFTIDNITLNVTQNTFAKFGFDGKFNVPLIDGTIRYQCDIYNQKTIDKDRSGYAYIFKVQSIENLNMDFFLAKASVDKEQTYLLVEAEDQPSGETKTRVELCAGGDIDIGGKEYLEKQLNDLSKKIHLPIEISLPGIHFVNMRVANCPRWTSTYVTTLQEEAAVAAEKAKGGFKLAKNKEYTFGEENNPSLYFERGAWSLASAEKKIGPFTFALDDFSAKQEGKRAGLGITGRINLCDTIVSASASVTIFAEVDVAKMNLSYDKTEFDSASIACNFGGMVTLYGKLAVSDRPDKGYSGEIQVGIKGLFTAAAKGGYFEHTSTGENDRNYTWGYFSLKVEGSIPLGTSGVFLTNLMGGFYFNCVRPMDPADPKNSLNNKPTPQYGIIGIDLGTGLSAGPSDVSIVEGKFTLTVVYDKERNRLTTFLFTGNAKALAGMVEAEVTLHYQNDDQDQYLRINITMDAMADAAKVVKEATGMDMDELNEKMGKMSDELQAVQEKLHGSAVEIFSGAEGGLENAIGDKSGDTGRKTDHAQSKKAKENSGISASAGATISIEFAVIFKENGVKPNKPYWHFYLGEPDPSKRCRYQWIDFKSKIVSVNIGADGYLCISNHGLPGKGLPEIPKIIRDFLTGGSRGAGVQSASEGEANQARSSSMDKFNKAINEVEDGAGVMLGASIWGYIDVDLGILYANMGAIAGFDVCLQHYKEAYCTNIEGEIGYKGWYATGQLYAYLYAKMGLHIDLGFWEKRFDIIDAGLGGVLKCGLPHPSWAEGEARCKLRMFGGLVNINKKYTFECGKVCKVFYGNALDNFELFGGCSIGYDNKKEGWDSKNKISPRLQSFTSIETQALLNAPIRVVDPTDAAALQDEKKDSATIAAEASRTFYFKFWGTGNNQAKEYAVLYQYDNPNESGGKRTVITVYNNNKSGYRFDMQLALQPNKYYKLVLTGEAKEARNGSLHDPETYDKQLKKYVNKPWTNSKEFFFCTGPDTPMPEMQPIQSITRIVFPSEDGQHLPTRRVNAYVDDVRRPNIALTDTRFKDQCYKHGTLMWQLLDDNGRVLEEVENLYQTGNNSLNMMPSIPFKNVTAGRNYTIRLAYVTKRTEQIRTVTTERDTEVDFLEDTYSQQELAEQAKDITEQTGVKLSNADKQNIRAAVMAKKEDFRLKQGTADEFSLSKDGLGHGGDKFTGSILDGKLEKDIGRDAIRDQIKDQANIRDIKEGAFGGIGGGKGGALDGIGGGKGGAFGGIGGGKGGTLGGIGGGSLGGGRGGKGGTLGGGRGPLGGNTGGGKIGTVTSPSLSHNYGSTGNPTQGAIFSTTTSPVLSGAGGNKLDLGNKGGMNMMGKGSGMESHMKASMPKGSEMRHLIRPLVDEERGPMTPQNKNSKPGTVKVSYRDTTIVTTQEVFSMQVHTVDGDWKTGNLEYSKPYVSYRLNKVDWKDTSIGYSDKDMSAYHTDWDSAKAYLHDPYAYFAYLGNAAFLGGMKIECPRLNINNVTTSQSLIYTTPIGKWEGMYRLFQAAEAEYEEAKNKWVKSTGPILHTSGKKKNKPYNAKEMGEYYETRFPRPNTDNFSTVSDAYPILQRMGLYDRAARGNHPQYSLYPLHRWGEVNVQKADDAYELRYTPSTNDRTKVSHALQLMAAPYWLAWDLSSTIALQAIDVSTEAGKGKDFTGRANGVGDWVDIHNGVYFKSIYDPETDRIIYDTNKGNWSTQLGWAAVEIPWYQFAIAWGGTENNADSNKKVTLHTTTPLGHSDWRVHREVSQTIWDRLNKWEFDRKQMTQSARYMKRATFTIYRVGAYNTQNFTLFPLYDIQEITIDDPMKDIVY